MEPLELAVLGQQGSTFFGLDGRVADDDVHRVSIAKIGERSVV